MNDYITIGGVKKRAEDSDRFKDAMKNKSQSVIAEAMWNMIYEVLHRKSKDYYRDTMGALEQLTERLISLTPADEVSHSRVVCDVMKAMIKEALGKNLKEYYKVTYFALELLTKKLFLGRWGQDFQ